METESKKFKLSMDESIRIPEREKPDFEQLEKELDIFTVEAMFERDKAEGRGREDDDKWLSANFPNGLYRASSERCTEFTPDSLKKHIEKMSSSLRKNENYYLWPDMHEEIQLYYDFIDHLIQNGDEKIREMASLMKLTRRMYFHRSCEYY